MNAIKNIFIEINLISKKWLISGSYNPKLSHIKNHLQEIGKGLQYYSSKYENFIVLGDFNAEMSNPHMSEFCALYNLTNLIKEPKCYKNVDKPTSIDLILTNHARCFQHSGIHETGLSDFHKLTITVLKMFYAKQKPRIIQDRDYKNFNNITFRMDLLKELSLSKLKKGDFDKFKFIVNNLLESHAAMEEKYIRRNQAPFMNKSVRKAVMVRTQLLNKFRKENSFINELAYKRQRNFCTKLIKKTKMNFYNNLNVNKITNNKSFWKTVKPSFTEKTLKDEKIVLVENYTTFSEENEVAEIFRSYFDGIVDGLNIKRCEISKEDSDPILNAIKTFEKHPSILKIKQLSSGCRFSFENVSLDDVKKVTRELDVSKASQPLDIPTKIIRQNADIFSEFFFANINHSINNSTFPDQLKWADVKPVFKKNSRTVKENYRPVSILPNISKIYERCLYTQLYDYFDVIFSQNQCGFRKGFSVVNCLLPMIEKWRESLDQGGAYGALLTDLSKAFDCLPHELIIAKLHAYGVDIPSLRLINACSETAQQNSVRLEIPFEGILHYFWVVSFSLGAGFLLTSSTYTVLLCSL